MAAGLSGGMFGSILGTVKHCPDLAPWLVLVRLGETWKLQAFAATLMPFQSLSPKYGTMEAVFFVSWAFWIGVRHRDKDSHQDWWFSEVSCNLSVIFFLKPLCAGSCTKESLESLAHTTRLWSEPRARFRQKPTWPPSKWEVSWDVGANSAKSHKAWLQKVAAQNLTERSLCAIRLREIDSDL